MIIRKILFLILGIFPCVLYAAQVPFAPGTTGIDGANCSVNDATGALVCFASDSGMLINLGNTNLYNNGSSTGIKLVNLTSPGTPGNIINTSTLTLSPGSTSANGVGANGSITVAGYIKNGVVASDIDLDDVTGTVPMNPLNAWMILNGGTIEIWNSALHSAALINLSYLTSPSLSSVEFNASGNISISGNVWNNTADGLVAFQSVNAAGNISLNANGALLISGGYTSFGGSTILTSGGDLRITGAFKIANNTLASGTNVITAGGAMTLGDTVTFGGVTLSSGTTTFSAVNALTINGDFSNLTGAGITTLSSSNSSINITGNLLHSAAGIISLSALDGINIGGTISANTGTMNINSGNGVNSVLNVGGISTTGGLMRVNGGSGMILGSNGLDLSGDMIVGSTVGNVGNLEINVASNTYRIVSEGDIDVARTLNVATGQTIEFQGVTTALAPVISVSFGGAITNAGNIIVGIDAMNNKISGFTAGAIGNGSSGGAIGSMTVNTVNDITVGNVDNWAGSKISFNAGGDLNINGYYNNRAGSLASSLNADGAIKITNAVTNMTNLLLSAGGDISMGSVANTNADFIIANGGTVSVTGNMSNTSNGNMYLGWNTSGAYSQLGSFNVGGILITDGVFRAEVIGATTLGGLNTLGSTSFYLRTGTLSVTGGYDALFNNQMNLMHLELTSGAINTTSVITNGAALNTGATMYMAATEISTGRIVNFGGLEIYATNGDLEIISGGIQNNAGGDMVLNSVGITTINGNTMNNAGAHLKIVGEGGINIGSINNYGIMELRTNFVGTERMIAGMISNNGGGTDLIGGCNAPGICDLYINVNQLEAGIFTNSSGLAYISFLTPSDGTYNNFQAINAAGGRVDVSGVGTMYVGNDGTGHGISVGSGGFLNMLSGFMGITIDNAALDIAGTITFDSGYSAGNLNVSSPLFIIDAGIGAINIGNGLDFSGASNVLGLVTTGNISVGGNVVLSGAAAHTLTLGAIPGAGTNTLNIAGMVSAAGLGSNIINLAAVNTTMTSLVQAGNGKIVARGRSIIITNGGSATFEGMIAYGSAGGFEIASTGAFALNAQNITFSGANIGAGGDITLNANASSGILTSSGAIYNAGSLSMRSGGDMTVASSVTNAGTLSMQGANMSIGGTLSSGGTLATITNTAGVLSLQGVENTNGTMTINNFGRAIIADGLVSASGGNLTFDATSMTVFALSQIGAGQITFNGSLLQTEPGVIGPYVNLEGDLAFGNAGGAAFGLNLTANNVVLDVGGSIDVGGALVLYSGSARVNQDALSVGDVTLNALETKLGSGTLGINAGNFTVKGIGLSASNTFVNNAVMDISANYISIANGLVNNDNLTLYATTESKIENVLNSGTMTLTVDNGDAIFGEIINNGVMTVLAWGGDTDVGGITNLNGTLALNGGTLSGGAVLSSSGDITVGKIYHDGVNYTGDAGALSLLNDNYSINMASGAKLYVRENIRGGQGNRLVLNTNVLEVGGDINSNRGTIIISAANFMGDCGFGLLQCPNAPHPNYDLGTGWEPWLNAKISGNISGGVQFYGLGRMVVGGDYIFDDKSILSIAALPNEGLTTDGRSSFIDITGAGEGYGGGAEVILDITTDSAPIITVDGAFITNIQNEPDLAGGQHTLEGGEIGLAVFDIITENTAIWLLKADNIEHLGYLPRNLSLYFCNADGTKCIDYMSMAGVDMPMYMRQDSSTGDGGPLDSLFVVFDPKYGGPIRLLRIRPEIEPLSPAFNIGNAAGAIDNWIDFGLSRNKFNSASNPIETLQLAFRGTIYEEMAYALYNRLEMYHGTYDRSTLYEFSRLFVPVEINQISNMIDSSERQVQQALQKRMMDESLWTRNRVKGKLWADVDTGLQNITNPDGNNPIDGTRVSIMGGYDIQIKPGTIIGFNAGYTMMRSVGDENFNLGYGPVDEVGSRSTAVNDTAINIGGYLLTRISETAELYISANIHSHTIALDKQQEFVNSISGDTSTSSISGEFGLIHSISAQYVTGNLSVRFAQNDGFMLSEKVGGLNYMDIVRPGYATISPGYQVMFQKRMYIKPTFIMRPYMSVGAEYAVIEMKKDVEYKFSNSDLFSTYQVDYDPIWVTGRVGLEFLSIAGLQFGASYNFHYNAAIQTHNLNLSASMRF